MDERHRVLIADSYPDEAEQLKKELSGKYNVISVRDNGVDTLDDIIKLKPDPVVFLSAPHFFLHQLSQVNH